MQSEYAHVIANLVAVIALMSVLMFFMKKFKLTKFAANKHIKIINVMPIGAKEKIILMEVNKKFLLLGATSSQIKTLHVFDEFEWQDENVSQKKNFMELVKRS